MANPRHQVKSRALDCPTFSCSTARYPNVSYRVILLLAMNQTLTDGASPSGVYAAVSMLALLIVLPLAPFSMNMDRWLNGITLIIFIPRDPHNCVGFVSFPHRPRAAGGAFYNYTSPYGAVRQEDRITLRERMFGEYDFPNVQPKGGKVKTPVEIAQNEVKKGIFEGLTSRLGLSSLLDLPFNSFIKWPDASSTHREGYFV
ncbi:hypothetical protein C8R48DRAFT_219614 [Suillus tomentosus]|nr:hypothetical protein C8R48DRAFT_219614 [Suillus tomentosus]